MNINAKDVLLAALDARWAKYYLEFNNCRAKFSRKAVHDLRVAARRLLAMLDILRVVFPRERIQKIRRELKSALNSLDELRDTQVILADVAAHIETVPEFAPFQKRLLKTEKRLLDSARKAIKKQSAKDLAMRVEKLHWELSALNEETLATQLRAALNEASARVARRYAAINPQKVASIHRLRIAFKKFRYMLEIAHPLIENFPPENLERMREYQTLMGEIQDMGVALQSLSAFSADKPMLHLETARQHYEERLRQSIANYLDRKSEASEFL